MRYLVQDLCRLRHLDLCDDHMATQPVLKRVFWETLFSDKLTGKVAMSLCTSPGQKERYSRKCRGS